MSGARDLTRKNVRVSGFKRHQQNGIFGTTLNTGTLLLQGVEPWNAWRFKNWRTRPNLSAANLTGAILIAADLMGAARRTSRAQT